MASTQSCTHATAFFGRDDELRAFRDELANPRGSAILVIGQQGMGKTMLLDRLGETARAMSDLKCGAVREEVTKTDTVDNVLAVFLDRAYEAANLTEGSFETTPRRLEQWRAFLNIFQVGDLVQSLRRDPVRNAREQFLTAIERIAGKLPADGRAVFIIDPEKYLPRDSDEDWAIVIKRLPEKIKLVFAQRPDDALAQCHSLNALNNVIRIPSTELDVLDQRGFDDLVNTRASETGMTPARLREVLAPYDLHPYATVAAVDLLAAGVAVDQLPSDPTPEKIAAAQWQNIQRGGHSESRGELAVRLFESYALLEVPVPDEVVEPVSGLGSAERKALLADRFLGPLIREKCGPRRIYHAILADHIRAQITPAEAETYHRRAIDVYRSRLHAPPPDGLPARRLPVHVRAVEGDVAFVICFVYECTPRLFLLGHLEEIEAMTAQGLAIVREGGNEEAALRGNLGNVMQTRSDFEGADAMYRSVAQIYERLGDHGGLATTLNNLGTIMHARGDFDSAESMHRKALEIYERLGHPEGMAMAYGHLGLILRIRGDLNGAEAMQRKALAINEKLGFRKGVADDYINLGLIMENCERYKDAKAMYRAAIDIVRELGDRVGMAIAYSHLGGVMRTCGEVDGAEAMHRKALEINMQLEHREGIASEYGNLGLIMLARDEHDPAEAMLQESLKIYQDIGCLEGIAIQYGNLGNIKRERGDLDAAEEMYRESLTIDEKLGRLEGMATAYANLGVLARRRGDIPKARDLWTKSRDLFAQFGAQHTTEKVQDLLDQLPE